MTIFQMKMDENYAVTKETLCESAEQLIGLWHAIVMVYKEETEKNRVEIKNALKELFEDLNRIENETDIEIMSIDRKNGMSE